MDRNKVINIIVIALVLGAGVFLVYKIEKSKNNNNSSNTNVVTVATPTPAAQNYNSAGDIRSFSPPINPVAGQGTGMGAMGHAMNGANSAGGSHQSSGAMARNRNAQAFSSHAILIASQASIKLSMPFNWHPLQETNNSSIIQFLDTNNSPRASMRVLLNVNEDLSTILNELNANPLINSTQYIKVKGVNGLYYFVGQNPRIALVYKGNVYYLTGELANPEALNRFTFTS